MYGLDINFLKDREIRPVDVGRARRKGDPADRKPLLLGLLAAVAALGAVGGYWFFLKQQINRLTAREEQLDTQIADVQTKLQELETVRAQIDLVKAENAAFVNVFNEIRPWSAFLKELRDRTPNRVQVTSIAQTAGTTVPGAPKSDGSEGGTPPPATGGVSITGVACSFNDVNDFLLTLQRSPMLDGNSITIATAQKRAEILDPQVDGVCPGSPPDRPEVLVDFNLTGNFSSVPSTALLDVLDRQGAVGLATRIRALRDSGVIQNP